MIVQHFTIDLDLHAWVRKGLRQLERMLAAYAAFDQYLLGKDSP